MATAVLVYLREIYILHQGVQSSLLVIPFKHEKKQKTRFENTKVHACENKTFKIASAMKEKYAMMKKRSSAIPQMANKFVVYILSTKTFHSFWTQNALFFPMWSTVCLRKNK